MNTVNTRAKFFPNVTDEQWNDWHWQVKNRIESLEDLKKYITLSAEEEEGVKKTLETLRMAITPYYFSLMDINDPNCPVRKQAIPSIKEIHQARLPGQSEGFFSTVVPAYICQHNIPLREINFLQPLCVRQQIRAGVVNDYPLAFGIHHDGGLRRFRLVIPFGVTGVNAPGFQLCQQAVARVVITDATNKIDLRPQPCRRNRCRRRWPATNFRIISRHVFTALRR